LRVKGALLTVLVVLAPLSGVLPRKLFASSPMLASTLQQPEPGQPAQAPPPLSPLFKIASYQGLIVRSIHFTSPAEKLPQDRLDSLVQQKIGKPLDRDLIRQSVRAIYETGRFADIQVQVERVSDNQVDLTFIVIPNYFVGDVSAEGAPDHPSANQIVNASKFQLGELFTQEKMDRALNNIKQLLQENGFYRATVSQQEQQHPDTQQVDILFRVRAGSPAHIGRVTVAGNPGYSQGQIQDIANMDPGDRVSADRVTKGLQRLRKKYQKQNRLLAQVSIVERVYHAESNAVDYTFQIDPGPRVEIGVEGFRIRHSVLKKNVPVYEEGAFDADLLNEGRRNLLDYLQTRGYFDAKVGIRKPTESAESDLQVTYTIDPGLRHKLLKVDISGNKYFDERLISERMQVQPASGRFSYGRFSQRLLDVDLRDLEQLYQANGFRQVQIQKEVLDNYEGVEAQLAVLVRIDEGPQTLVGVLHIEGNYTIPQDQLLPLLTTTEGQPFSEFNIASDRDSILNYYFNHGFPQATFEASTAPMSNEPNRMAVTYTIHEGEEFFVNKVLVSGLNFTRPYVVDRELRVIPETPLSQEDMLDTQRHLYALGIFNQVDTAVQNPDGAEPNKNVLVDVHEAKRYTFDYGLGLEVQTGQPGVGSLQPQGATGASPRVSFDVTRLNLWGRDQTISFKTHVGRLQQRALVSFDAPKWMGKNFRLSVAGLYDNTLDVTTFTSQRLEGSVQTQQTLSRVNTMIYRFTYRLVKATNIVVSQDLIPLYSQPTRVGMPGFTYIRDKRDNPLETTRGNYTTLDGGTASSYFGSEANFGRMLIQNSTYLPLGKDPRPEKKYVLARSTRIGIESPFGGTVIVKPGEVPNCSNCVIPLPERFLMGGGNSHRGFGLNQAGPRDPTTGFPLGGSALFLNNIELRLPPLITFPLVGDNVSFAVFHDAGNVFSTEHEMVHSFLNWRQPNRSLCQQESTRFQCSYDYISQAVGIGVRYRTPIGPVRFDFGYNLNPPAFPSCVVISAGQCKTFGPQQLRRFNLFFSIGQTF
jgi:outer membrane protein insertion porin family